MTPAMAPGHEATDRPAASVLGCGTRRLIWSAAKKLLRGNNNRVIPLNTLQRAACGAACRNPGRACVNLLLKLSHGVDWINAQVGRYIYWLVLVAVLVSSGNAMIRKAFDMSSNAWLELQWYLNGAVFLLCAGYTHLKNEHIKIDVFYGRFTRRTQILIDIFGTLLFLLPMCVVIMKLSWPRFVDSYISAEMSTNAGGLIVWPAKLLIPAGFALLFLQGLSELVKRIAFLQGLIPDPVENKNYGH
jgi:TRAP-type mannitol/chloroaromatic compound transport system permease small subunit